jgi:hypothetical protein
MIPIFRQKALLVPNWPEKQFQRMVYIFHCQSGYFLTIQQCVATPIETMHYIKMELRKFIKNEVLHGFSCPTADILLVIKRLTEKILNVGGSI